MRHSLPSTETYSQRPSCCEHFIIIIIIIIIMIIEFFAVFIDWQVAKLFEAGQSLNVCEVGTFGKISDCQPEGSRFNPRPC